MDDVQFSKRAAQELSSIELAVESAIEHCSLDFDVHLSADGVLEIELIDGNKVVINSHAGMQEIWLAARSGAHHFRFGLQGWCDTRDGAKLREVLAGVLLTQSAGALKLDRND